jgi:uncharacterized membrane protein (UPF0127 family)
MTLSRQNSNELLARATIVVLFTLLSINILRDFLHTGRVTGLLLLVNEALVIVLTVIRRPAQFVDRSIRAAMVTVISVIGPPLLLPSSMGGMVPDLVTAIASALGLGLVVVGKLTLGRSFGLVPANRGVVIRGPDRASTLVERRRARDRRHRARRPCAHRGAGPQSRRRVPGLLRACRLASRAGSVLMANGKTGSSVRLMNERTQNAIASIVEIAVSREDRRRGLLGRNGLDASAAMMLAPCAAVHTAFMRFALDVVFVDRTGRVRKIVRGLEPWRMSASLGAYAAIELAAGGPRDLVPGDRLYLSNPAVGEDTGASVPLEMAVKALVGES